LTIDEGAALASVYLDEVDFPANSCAIVEGCVEGPGLRKLLRFSTMTPNIGNADFMLGPPQDHADLFEFSPCHGHYHFNGYANYELLSMDGDVVARGHKQAFCLLDSTRVLSGADIPQFGQFHCGYQGITRGWADIYGANLDCQWVDVTEVPPGAYKLRMSVNTGRTIEELSYDNNSIEIPILIPRNDPLAPCDLSPDALGEYRDCGWELDGSRTCNPGEPVAVGCAAQCQLGSCEGDPVLRVCEGEDNACPAVRALGNADNACGGQCPVVNFTCPQSGRYTVLRGASEPEGAYACEVAAQTGFILADPRDSCGQRETGLGRDCDWDDGGAWLCEPGTQVRLGCAAAGACALGSCTGDSMLRLCDGHDNPCTGDRSLQQNDDACSTYCSLIDFVCPDSGVLTALTAPYTSGNEYGCELEMDGGQRCPVDAFEPNSDPRFAPLLTEGSHEPLTLCRGEAENYIIFANEPDTIRLDFHFDSPDAEVKLQLFDPDGRLLQEGAGAAPSIHMAYEVDVPGRYRLTAELLRGGWIGYSVDLSLYEP
jgi:hypothetical protein